MRVQVRRQAEAIVLPVLGVAVVLAAFEVAPRVGILPRETFPPFSEIARAFGDLVSSGDLWAPLRDTLDSWLRAIAIATLIGVPLGLAIVARVAESHDGSVTVENRPTGGAAFTLRLRPATA